MQGGLVALGTWKNRKPYRNVAREPAMTKKARWQRDSSTCCCPSVSYRYLCAGQPQAPRAVLSTEQRSAARTVQYWYSTGLRAIRRRPGKGRSPFRQQTSVEAYPGMERRFTACDHPNQLRGIAQPSISAHVWHQRQAPPGVPHQHHYQWRSHQIAATNCPSHVNAIARAVPRSSRAYSRLTASSVATTSIRELYPISPIRHTLPARSPRPFPISTSYFSSTNLVTAFESMPSGTFTVVSD
eukprot:IDg11130t1